MNMINEKQMIARIVEYKLKNRARKIDDVKFSTAICEDGRVGVTAHVYMGNWIYYFTADTQIPMPYYADANTVSEAVQKFIEDAEQLELYKDKREKNIVAESFNRKQIVACLIESYTEQLEHIIKEYAEATADKIMEQDVYLQERNYEEITYDPQLDYTEGEELADNNYQIGGKIDRDLFCERVELALQMAEWKADVAEDEEENNLK